MKPLRPDLFSCIHNINWQPEKPLLTKQANTINAEYALRFADTAINLVVSGIPDAK
jgi:hypothetical protein